MRPLRSIPAQQRIEGLRPPYEADGTPIRSPRQVTEAISTKPITVEGEAVAAE
jgi:hypothetical protein